jgi:hypothetical protein
MCVLELGLVMHMPKIGLAKRITGAKCMADSSSRQELTQHCARRVAGAHGPLQIDHIVYTKT